MADLKNLRMCRVFAVTWGKLPEAARLEVLAGLGTAQILAISDNHFGLDVTASGYAQSMGSITFIHVDSQGVAAYKQYAAFLILHELGHVAMGHVKRTLPSLELTLAPNEHSITTSIYRILLQQKHQDRQSPPIIGPVKGDRSEYYRREAEADAWASKWGHPRPGSVTVEDLDNAS